MTQINAPRRAESETERADDSGLDIGLLNRVERMAAAYTIVLAIVDILALGWRQAIVLTGVSAVSILSFRLLRLEVSLLEPRPQEDLGTRNSLLIALRFFFLCGVVIAALHFSRQYPLALVLGFASVPVALTAEACRRLVWPKSRHDR